MAGRRFAPDQHQRIAIDEYDRRQVLLGIERKLLIERHVCGDLQIVQQQRVAVGRRLHDLVGRDDGAAAADVFDDEILLELVCQCGCDLSCGLVGRAAGRVGHDDGDGPARIVVRTQRGSDCAKTDCGQCDCDDAPHHSLLPGYIFSMQPTPPG